VQAQGGLTARLNLLALGAVEIGVEFQALGRHAAQKHDAGIRQAILINGGQGHCATIIWLAGARLF